MRPGGPFLAASLALVLIADVAAPAVAGARAWRQPER